MKSSRWETWCAVAVLAVSVCTGCNSPSGSESAHSAKGVSQQFDGQPPLSIVCTTQQVADAVRNIAGEHAEVEALMGPGVDPHLFRTKPSVILQLQQADIIFYNGLHLEGKIADTLEQLSSRKPVVPLTGRLVADHDSRLLSPTGFSGVHDPHVWHDVSLWADCVDYAAEQLCEFDPQRADDYRANASAYRKQLDELDAEVRAQLETIPQEQRLLVTAHDAFSYFSAAYGLKTIGLKGISTDDEADFAHLDAVRKILVDNRVPAVFVESSTSPRLVNKLIEECQSAGHEVRLGEELYSDAMGGAGSGAEEYVGMIQANVSAIVDGLAGEQQP
ncbi:metal ABC transporter solute-binding protein, Zn/Mn family [Aeoliella sp.]|uniref:metal ABC transporter solute-binding protein, Zn/Mn family n=1 Tax=Aeoliella sp. TaxID=2795800 RepID=UPI003CCB9F2A